jgi:hypothetical protein
MSFRCGSCAVAVRPGIKPVVQAFEAPTVHSYFDEEKNRKESLGLRIVREVKLCQDCGGAEHKERVCNFVPFVLQAKFIHRHTRRCDGTIQTKKWNREQQKFVKTTEDCIVCKRGMEAFATFPPQALSAALEEEMVPTRKFNIASLALASMVERTRHQSVRANAGFQTAYAVLGAFRKRGGGF